MKAPEKIWINPSMDLPKLNGVIDKESVQYVRKDTLAAEIERRIKLFTNEKNQSGMSQIDKLSLGGRIAGLQELKVFLDTLEM